MYLILLLIELTFTPTIFMNYWRRFPLFRNELKIVNMIETFQYLQ